MVCNPGVFAWGCWCAEKYDPHYEPMCSLCQFCSYNYSFIGKLENAAQDLPALMQHLGWCPSTNNAAHYKNLSSFLFPPPPKFLKEISLKLYTRLIKSKTFFHYRKLTSIRVVFCLNKTLFTHFDYNYARIKCLLITQNRKLLIFYQKSVTAYGKRVNKVCI